MKTLKIALIGLIAMSVTAAQAESLDAHVKALGANILSRTSMKTNDNTPTTPPSPIRYAKMRVRVTKSVLNSDPNSPGFVHSDVCIIESSQVPVFDERQQLGGTESPLGKSCTDPDNKVTVNVWGMFLLLNSQIIDSKSDVKLAIVGLTVDGNTPTTKIPSAYSYSASKDLNLKSMLVVAEPTGAASSTCSTDSQGNTTCQIDAPNPIYYSLIADLED